MYRGSNWGCTGLRTPDTPTSSQDNLSEVKQKCKAHIHCWGNKLDIFCRKGLQRKLHRWLGNGKMSHSGALWPQDHYRRKEARNFQRKNQPLRNKSFPAFRDTHFLTAAELSQLCCSNWRRNAQILDNLVLGAAVPKLSIPLDKGQLVLGGRPTAKVQW